MPDLIARIAQYAGVQVPERDLFDWGLTEEVAEQQKEA